MHLCLGLLTLLHDLLVKLRVLQLQMLVQGALRAIGFLAGHNLALEVPVDQVGWPSVSLQLPVAGVLFLLLELKNPLFQQVLARQKLLHLRCENNVGVVQATVLVVIVVAWLVGVQPKIIIQLLLYLQPSKTAEVHH